MAERSILFICNAGPDVGGGHVMRCLTLAGALKDRGLEPAFLATPEVAAILDAFAPPGIGRAADAAGSFDALAFDHYRLAATQQASLAKGRPVLVIDDLADRPLAADLLVDSGPARRPGDYDGLVPPHAQVL